MNKSYFRLTKGKSFYYGVLVLLLLAIPFSILLFSTTNTINPEQTVQRFFDAVKEGDIETISEIVLLEEYLLATVQRSSSQSLVLTTGQRNLQGIVRDTQRVLRENGGVKQISEVERNETNLYEAGFDDSNISMLERFGYKRGNSIYEIEVEVQFVSPEFEEDVVQFHLYGFNGIYIIYTSNLCCF